MTKAINTMIKVYTLATEEEWIYVFENKVQIEMGYIIPKEVLYDHEIPQLKLLGEIDVEKLNEKIKETAGGGFHLGDTPLLTEFSHTTATKVVFGKDGRLYTFRQPEDILHMKLCPVRLGYFFKQITPELLKAWEQYQAYCRAEAIITSDPEVWRKAYQEVKSCMQNKEEIEFYIENKHAFEIGVLIDKKDNRIFARTVIYKTTDGARYHGPIYSDRPFETLEKILRKEGIFPATQGGELPPVKVRSKIGIPFMDAYCFGSIVEKEEKENEKIWTVIFRNTNFENYDFIARFTEGTKEMILFESRCYDCERYYPELYLYDGLCPTCTPERYLDFDY